MKFNRNKFDRNKFDRYADPGISIRMYGIGSIGVDSLVYSPIKIFLYGSSSVLPILFAASELTYNDYDNFGNIDLNLVVITPLTIDIGGSSELKILNIGNSNISRIELIDISLLPGETITIDTDLMVILLGLIHDVSSLTVDSEFFQLGPGLNELYFDYNLASGTKAINQLEVTTIWQNRWL